MKTAIKKLSVWLDDHPKLKEWAWFIGLWCAGLLTVMAMTYPIKLIIKLM